MANGSVLYCLPSNDPTLLIINPQGRIRRATEVNDDGIVDDARGRSVTSP
jgi:hypothetical protein